MKKTILCLLLFFGLNAQALAEVFVNVVQSASVNSLNLILPVTYAQLVKSFGKPDATKVSNPDGCMPSMVVTASYSGKKGQIVYFEQDNPLALFRKPFEYQNTRLKGKLTFHWKTTASLSEKVLLDGWQVLPSLSFDQFKQRFSQSAKNPYEAGKKGEVKYVVVLGLNDKSSPKQISLDEVYLSRYMLFTFKNKKLTELSIN